MEQEAYFAAAAKWLAEHEHNYVSEADALRDDLIGMQMYDEPLFGVADAADPLFPELQKPEVDHPDYWLPQKWLPGAKRIISCFMPFTMEAKKSNEADMQEPSAEWLHCRIEGQEMVALFGTYLRDELIKAGYEAVCPTVDERFCMLTPRKACWSERHTAFICGLGTFGMSKGIITAKGMAGRLVSVITDYPFEVTPRPYTDRYEYCTKCGKCARNCPARAIDPQKPLDQAKDHDICEPFTYQTKAAKMHGDTEKRYFGCGKCQVAVPCRDRIPAK